MNGLVSGASTILVDLPEVEDVATRMLGETGLAHHVEPDADGLPESIPLVVSNYAFTELSKDVQDQYLRKYLVPARHGMIISNAGVFAKTIGGRSDEDLLAWLNAAGVPAVLDRDSELLSSIDSLGGVGLIHW